MQIILVVLSIYPIKLNKCLHIKAIMWYLSGIWTGTKCHKLLCTCVDSYNNTEEVNVTVILIIYS
jgi:hypothetical protein